MSGSLDAASQAVEENALNKSKKAAVKRMKFLFHGSFYIWK